MNKTHIEHAVIAVFLQLILIPVLGVYSALVPISIFFGREYAQAEYKVQRITGRSIANMMPWHVLKIKYWSLDSILDVVAPVIVCIPVTYLLW